MLRIEASTELRHFAENGYDPTHFGKKFATEIR